MREALEVIVDYYEGNPNVEISFIDNTLEKGKAALRGNIGIFKRVEAIEALRQRLKKETKETNENGDIRRTVYFGSLGRGRAGEDSPGIGRETSRPGAGRIERIQAEETTGGESNRGAVRGQLERSGDQETREGLIGQVLSPTSSTTQKPIFDLDADDLLSRSRSRSRSLSIEQRNGCGHRQRNRNDLTKALKDLIVEVNYYTTQSSFDVAMCQALTGKSSFIREFMRGDI